MVGALFSVFVHVVGYVGIHGTVRFWYSRKALIVLLDLKLQRPDIRA